MTLGERIANKRKAAGLSQEELGNILGVTRQSIYKWENDQAVPELENLLQLSRVFEITVGWLVNEETDGSTDDVTISESLNEAAQKINTAAEKADGAISEHIQANNKAFMCLAAILVCAIVIFGLQLRKLESKYRDIQSSVNDVVIYAQGKIDSVVNAVNGVLSQYASLTVSDDIEILGVDFDENLITLRVYAKPKTYTQGLTGTVSVRSGDETFAFEATLDDDKGFTADIAVPLSDFMEICFEFDDNGTTEIVKLADYTGWYSYSFGEYEIDWPLPDVAGSLDRYCEVSVYTDANFDFFGVVPFPELVSINVVLLEDDVVIAEYERLSGLPDDAINMNSPNYTTIYFRRPDGLSLKPGKTYTEVLTLTDEYGRVLEKRQSSVIG